MKAEIVVVIVIVVVIETNQNRRKSARQASNKLGFFFWQITWHVQLLQHKSRRRSLAITCFALSAMHRLYNNKLYKQCNVTAVDTAADCQANAPAVF